MLALGGAAGAQDVTVTLLAPCGHRLVYPDSGAVWNLGAARDEGGGVVSQLAEVSGDFAHRQIELVDCRRGTELFVTDVMIDSGDPWPLQRGTGFQGRLAALRQSGGLRDLGAAIQGFGIHGQPVSLDVDWRTNFDAACACEAFYPGSSGLPADQVPAPDEVHGVDAPVTSP